MQVKQQLWNNWLVQNWESRSLCLFNLYAEYIMQNAGLDVSQAGTKIARERLKAKGEGSRGGEG